MGTRANASKIERCAATFLHVQQRNASSPVESTRGAFGRMTAVARVASRHSAQAAVGRWPRLQPDLLIGSGKDVNCRNKLAPRAWDVARPGPKLSSHTFHAATGSINSVCSINSVALLLIPATVVVGSQYIPARMHTRTFMYLMK